VISKGNVGFDVSMGGSNEIVARDTGGESEVGVCADSANGGTCEGAVGAMWEVGGEDDSGTSDERTIEFRNKENARRGGGGLARTTVASPSSSSSSSSSSSGSSGAADASTVVSVAESVSMSSSPRLPAVKDHLRGGSCTRCCGTRKEGESVTDVSPSVPSSPSSSSKEVSTLSVCWLLLLLFDGALQNAASLVLGGAGMSFPWSRMGPVFARFNRPSRCITVDRYTGRERKKEEWQTFFRAAATRASISLVFCSSYFTDSFCAGGEDLVDELDGRAVWSYKIRHH
jgi:hypothetical protein